MAPRNIGMVSSLALLIAVAAPIASATSRSRGTLMGGVTLGPTCPVVGDPPDPMCLPQPIRATVRIRSTAEARSMRVVTTAKGTYRVRLHPGTFVVTATSRKARFCGSKTVTVRSNEISRVDLTCDSGIR